MQFVLPRPTLTDENGIGSDRNIPYLFVFYRMQSEMDVTLIRYKYGYFRILKMVCSRERTYNLFMLVRNEA